MTQITVNKQSPLTSSRVTLWQQTSLLIALLINAMAHGYFAVVFPIIGREYTLEQWHISIILSVSAASMILFTPLWGKLCDKFGRRNIFLMGIGSSSLSCFFLAYCFSNNNFIATTVFWVFSIFLSIRIFHSIFTAGIHPAAQAILAETSTVNKRTKAMGFMGASFGLGTISGGSLAIFTGANDISLGFNLILGLLVLAFSICYKFLPETYSKPSKKIAFAIDLKIFLPMLLTTLVIIAIYSALQPLTAWRMQDDFSLNAQQAIKFTGAIMISSMLAMILIQSCIIPIIKLSIKQLRITGYIVSIIAMLFSSMVNSPMQLLFTMVIFGIGVGLLIPGNLAALSVKTASVHQARIAGVNGTFKGLGMAIGPVFGNMFYAINSTLFYWIAALALVILLTFTKRRSATF